MTRSGRRFFSLGPIVAAACAPAERAPVDATPPPVDWTARIARPMPSSRGPLHGPAGRPPDLRAGPRSARESGPASPKNTFARRSPSGCARRTWASSPAAPAVDLDDLAAADPSLARYAPWLELLAGLPNKIKGIPGIDQTGRPDARRPARLGEHPGAGHRPGARSGGADRRSGRRSPPGPACRVLLQVPGQARPQGHPRTAIPVRGWRPSRRPSRPSFEAEELEALLALDPGILRGPLLPRRGRAHGRKAPHGRAALPRGLREDPRIAVRPHLPGQGRLPDGGDGELSRMEREGAGAPADLPGRPARQGPLPRLPRPERRGPGGPRPAPRARHLLHGRRPLLDGLEPERARAARGGPEVDRVGQGLPRRRERRGAPSPGSSPTGRGGSTTPKRTCARPSTSIRRRSDAAYYLGSSTRTARNGSIRGSISPGPR